MRMWMLPPELLCTKHLIGEHGEVHKMIGNLRHSGKWAQSLTRQGYLEPQNAQSRHDELAREMLSRGYAHNTPLKLNGEELPKGKVDIERSIRDLLGRCDECRRRMNHV